MLENCRFRFRHLFLKLDKDQVQRWDPFVHAFRGTSQKSILSPQRHLLDWSHLLWTTDWHHALVVQELKRTHQKNEHPPLLPRRKVQYISSHPLFAWKTVLNRPQPASHQVRIPFNRPQGQRFRRRRAATIKQTYFGEEQERDRRRVGQEPLEYQYPLKQVNCEREADRFPSLDSSQPHSD